MITLPDDVSASLNTGMQVGSAIELPFFTPTFWFLNGDARLLQVGGASYFGGWAVSKEHWDRATKEEWFTDPSENAGLVETNLVTSDNKPLETCTSRSLIVAPMCSRLTWTTQDGGRYIEYVPGGRQHLQVIALLASRHEDGSFNALGPVMLTAKGFQAKNLQDSFAAWDRATKSIRQKVAPNVPAWCFYAAVGTFGTERKQVMVGKTSQKAITPVSCYIPKQITEDTITKLFVGQENAASMAVYIEAAQEWLHAYDARKAQPQPNQTQAVPQPPTYDELPPFDDHEPLPY